MAWQIEGYKWNLTRREVVRYGNGNVAEYVNCDVELSQDDITRILQSLAGTNFDGTNDELIISLSEVLTRMRS